MRAKISAVRASGARRLLTCLSQMRRLFEGGDYSSKYGIVDTVKPRLSELVGTGQNGPNYRESVYSKT